MLRSGQIGKRGSGIYINWNCGEPTSDLADKVSKGQNVNQIFPFDSTLEDNTIEVYNGYLEVCRQNGDSITMKIFETIIDEEQIHLNYFDNIGGHIKNLGDAYLARIAGTPSATGLGTSGFAVSGKQE